MVSQSAAAIGGALAQASAFAATVPLLPYGVVPRTVRAALALMLVPVVLSATPEGPHADPLLHTVIAGAVVGAAFGLSAAIVAGAVNAAGNAIDVALGSPPFVERTSTGGPISRLYQIAFTLVFLESGGLIVLVSRFARDAAGLPHAMHSWHGLAALGRASIGASLVLAGPSLFAQALATIVAGILARAAPQLNAILFSAPLASGLVLLALFAGAATLWSTLAEIVRQAVGLSGSFLS